MPIVLPHSDLHTLHDRLLEEIPPGSTVLDVGAGLAKYHPLLIDRGCKLTLLDAHAPYLEERRQRWPQIETVHADVNLTALWDWVVTERRWDVALAIDFIEHLGPDNARDVVDDMRDLAPKVILFVPEGNHPQDVDHYGMGGDHWQTHRSTWDAPALEALGFTVERWIDFHLWARERGCDPGALWATWRRP